MHGAGLEPARESTSAMAHSTILRGLGIAAALAAGSALGDDQISRALLERAQRADAFTLRVQQSLESARAGNLGPRERLEFDARQRDQRERQDELFYRQQTQTYVPQSGVQRRAEAMRAEQERQEQLSRFRFDGASPVGSKPPTLAPAAVTARVVTVPLPRAPAGPVTMPGTEPAQPEVLAMIRRVEYEADALWRAALAGDWSAAQGTLVDVRGSVEVLRSDRFRTGYSENGGRLDALSAVLDRLDSVISGAGIELEAYDAASVMRSANAMMLAAAELVPDIVRPLTRRSIGRK